MKLKNRVLAGMAMATMFTGMFATGVSAATETYANGDYVATSTMYKNNSGVINTEAKSACDVYFSEEATVTLTDDSTVITWYVETADYTGFNMEAVDNFIVTYEETTYEAVIDFDSEVEAIINDTVMMGHVMTLTLPAAAIDTIVNDGLLVSSYIPAMAGYANGAYATQTYWVKLSDVTVAPTDASKQTSSVNATVTPNEPSYTVTVPASIALGSLSRETDNVVAFDVKVETADFDGDSVEVVAVGNGTITDGTDSLAFTNDFGSQTATASTTLTGNITVLAANVAAVEAGNYTGTTSFVINYYAAE